ncbi:phage tail spike protein [Clostridium sp.]|uniref:phage tail spike protein n=1 Tax=Clostridium sp. TaxID=1506 RepID=UPI001A59CBAD|nr:phage tail spike protein [Clostridium sp.]MBK5243397.1 phage tail protein [Clostridium sp.]
MKKQIKVAYFPSTATKSLVLSSNGRSLDKYCIACSTEEDLSTGNYILDATFLIEDNLQDLLQEEVILKVLMDYGEEFFRISKPTVGTRYIDIVARQITIAEELTLWLEDVRPTGVSGTVAGNYMVANATGVKEIQVVSDISNIATAYYPQMNLYEALHDCDQSFLNRWGGEILRRGYIEYINSHIGISRGVTIREGKNLTGFECSSNIDNLVTRAQGKGFDGIVGNYIDSPLIGAYNRVYTDVIEYSDVKVNNENTTDGYATLAEAQAELDRRIQAEYDTNGIDKIKASYAINFVQLEKTEEYKNYIIAERVYLGDTIGVYVPKINTDIQVRAMNKKYDVLAQKTKEIILSNYIENKGLSIKQIIEKLESMDSTDDILQLAKDNATVLIKAGLKNSYVTVKENEIIIGDTKDINTMTNLWRFNNNGLGFSSTGYYGTFETAITADGHIVADFIDTGVLRAVQVIGGTIDGVVITGSTITSVNDLTIGAVNTTSNPRLIFHIGSALASSSYDTEMWLGMFEYGTQANFEHDSLNIEVKSSENDSVSSDIRAKVVIKGKGYGNYCDLNLVGNLRITTPGGIFTIDDSGSLATNGGSIATSGGNINTGIGNVTANNLYGKLAGTYVQGQVNEALNAYQVNSGGAPAQVMADSNNYALVAPGSFFSVVIGGLTRFMVNSDGTKTGGTIELDGKNWGMSPVDSPKILISDLLLNQEITPEGVVVTLDDKFSRAINGYAVFPSRADAVVSDKLPGSFRVTGTGKVDLYIIGKRIGEEEVYWVEMAKPEII